MMSERFLRSKYDSTNISLQYAMQMQMGRENCELISRIKERESFMICSCDSLSLEMVVHSN